MSKFILGLAAVIIFSSCSSSTSKLTKSDATEENRIVYGKIIDLNTESDPGKLQLTYSLSEERSNTILGHDKYPRLEPKSPYFWMTVPKDTTFIGVNSISFKLKSVDGEAHIRDDKTFKPLFGLTLTPGNSPVYIGDITIRSGTRKYSASVNAEGFDLKEAYIKNDAASAKEFLDKNGFNSKDMVFVPFKIKTYQEAKNHGRRNRL